MRAYVRLNSMGASFNDVLTEYNILWLHAFIYFLLACGVYSYQIYLSRRNARMRLAKLKAYQQRRKQEKEEKK